jgi:hypothetical protein
MADSDSEKKRRSDRLFGMVIGLHGVALLALGVGLFFFLQNKVPEVGGRSVGQVVYILGLLGVMLMWMGWRKYMGAPDPAPGAGNTTDGGGAGRDVDGSSSDGGGDGSE